MKWWNYSDYFFNIYGRICLEGPLVFGLAGCIIDLNYSSKYLNAGKGISEVIEKV